MFKHNSSSSFTNSSFKLLNSRLCNVKSLEKYSKFQREVENPFYDLCRGVYQEILDKGFKKYVGKFNIGCYKDNSLFVKIEMTGDNSNDLYNYFSIELCDSYLNFGLFISDRYPVSNLKRKLEKVKKNILDLYLYNESFDTILDIHPKTSCCFKNNNEYNSKKLNFKPYSQEFWQSFFDHDNYDTIKISNTYYEQNILGKSIHSLKQTISWLFLILLPISFFANYYEPDCIIEKYIELYNNDNNSHGFSYNLKKYIDKTNIEYKTLQNWILTLKRKKQIILQGSPGTGKTFIAENIAKYLIGDTYGFYDIIQFHPAYTYEDFIQGIRPQSNNGNLEYNLVAGRFLEFCNKAAACYSKCILIIDEINRANLSSVFGELMYLLEYRDKEIYLAGSQEKFKIPSNVYIIGTMNTADRSIALVDFALRRRFAFITVKPNYEVIRKFHKDNNSLQVDGLITVLESINKAIDDSNYSLGIAYFLIEDLASEIENIWCMEIEPYLEEYFYNSIEQVDEFRWDKVKNKILTQSISY